MAEYIPLIKGDIYNSFPDDIRDLDDTQFLALASMVNTYVDGLVSQGFSDGSLSIEQLDHLFKCDRIPQVAIDYVSHLVDAGVRTEDNLRTARQKICRAAQYNKRHGTVRLIRDLVEEVTGTTPDILVFTSFNRGWDADDSVDGTAPYTLDYEGGLFWDADNSIEPVLGANGGFIWSVIPTGILVDVKNDGAYTADQWERVLNIVAEQKRAELAAEVGYFDSGTGAKVVYQIVYSKDLTMVAWPSLVDPGL